MGIAVSTISTELAARSKLMLLLKNKAVYPRSSNTLTMPNVQRSCEFSVQPQSKKLSVPLPIASNMIWTINAGMNQGFLAKGVPFFSRSVPATIKILQRRIAVIET